MRKISRQTQAVLDVFADGGWHYGQEIIVATGLKAGTVYPVLSRLMARGQLEDRWETDEEHLADHRQARRYYRRPLELESSAADGT